MSIIFCFCNLILKSLIGPFILRSELDDALKQNSELRMRLSKYEELWNWWRIQKRAKLYWWHFSKNWFFYCCEGISISCCFVSQMKFNKEFTWVLFKLRVEWLKSVEVKVRTCKLANLRCYLLANPNQNLCHHLQFQNLLYLRYQYLLHSYFLN